MSNTSRGDRRLGTNVEDTVARLSRAAEEPDQTEARVPGELSDQDRLDMLRENYLQERLPNIPPIPGYHVCWLTESNTGDTPLTRANLGYEPVKVEDLPEGMRSLFNNPQTGQVGPILRVNEMMAFKLPERLYRRYMHALHHQAPREEETGIIDKNDAIKEQITDHEGRYFEGEGNRRLRGNRPAPPPESWGTGEDPRLVRAAFMGQRLPS